ncbi:type IV toxin-antitoxin system AbiEi family antitoxin domain-containing protein [Microbacterium hominis]|uniref:DUF559 domain-containing protein n=1 Tax=Microbacterium hominis TaxID=162426 RepID=A0A7D4QJE7_9MICO|nr:type IV toxin-antitoxin system AbiEi family antitoxin domain-containing protein [Microbacterium hominis]QKJ19856.1 DUF559 domain-containing protein [Microbacterium hominis]
MSRVDPLAVLSRRGGVVRTSTLLSDGVSRHAQARLVESGLAYRPCRGWIARSGADPQLVAAARAGVVLTCVTQARRLGLWVLDEPEIHVAAAPHAHVRVATAHAHWSRPVIPRHPDALVDPIENVLALVAQCRPHDEALVVWESALNSARADKAILGRLPLPTAAQALLDEAQPWSMSGLESFVPPRLRWLRLSIVPQAWIHGHRVDFLIGERLVLQVDGGHHVGAQREADIAHDAALMLLGYHVIRVGYRQVVDRWPEVQDLIMRAVAQGLHRAA